MVKIDDEFDLFGQVMDHETEYNNICDQENVKFLTGASEAASADPASMPVDKPSFYSFKKTRRSYLGVSNSLKRGICYLYEKILDFYKKKGRNYTIAVSCLFFASADSVIQLFRMIMFFYTLNRTWLWCNFLYMLAASVIPFVGWLFATESESFYYHKKKKFYFILALLHMAAVIVQPLMDFNACFLFPYFQMIKITPLVSKVMVMWLARVSILIAPAAFYLIIIPQIADTWLNENLMEQLLSYRLYHTFDIRKNKEWSYDLSICEDIETGEKVIEREEDRFIHKSVNGSSGSGKSSSTLLPTFYSDIGKKARNDDKRQHELEKMVREGKAFLHLPDDYDGIFRDEYVVPLETYKDEYREILNSYRTCGLIFLAPDDETCLKATNLTLAYGYKPKLIDPSAFTDDKKVGLLDYLYGINPLYVPMGLSIQGESIYVPRVAQDLEFILAQAEKTEGSGSSDGFFENVNKHVTSMIAQVTILYYRRVKNRQASFDDFVKHLQNPRTLIPVMSELEDLYGRCAQNRLREDEVFRPNERVKTDRDGNSTIIRTEKTYDPEYRKIAFKTHAEVGALGCTLADTSFENTFNQIYTELLNPGEDGKKGNENAKNIAQWSYGLKNIASNLIQRPELKKTLSYGKTIDFDQVLSNGEIVICNFCLHLGQSLATGFGLMVQLAINAAVLRRPYDAEIKPCPVFEICDEAPVILGNWAETSISLWRKYSCGITLAMQTSAQLEKTEVTKYLKGILQGVGTIAIFGRAGVEEMDIYTKLAGQSKQTAEVLQVNESSILDDTPQMSYGTRFQEQDVDIVSPTSIRNRDFQEATLFTTVQGRVVEARHVKMHFLPKDAFEKKERHTVDFLALSEEYPISTDEEAYLLKLKEEQKKLADEAEQKRIAIITSAKKDDGNKQACHGVIPAGPIGSLKVDFQKAGDESILEDGDLKDGVVETNYTRTGQVDEDENDDVG